MGVRWDAVVRHNEFWSASAGAPPIDCGEATVAAPVSLEVWLYGALADPRSERPLMIGLDQPFSILDLVAALARRGGTTLGDRLGAHGGGIGRLPGHCKVFVDGEPVEDVAAPVRVTAPRARIEVIFLTALEGG